MIIFHVKNIVLQNHHKKCGKNIKFQQSETVKSENANGSLNLAHVLCTTIFAVRCFVQSLQETKGIH